MYVKFNEIEHILKNILSTPTSPFRENLVIKQITEYLNNLGAEITLTKHNNLIGKLGRKTGKRNLYFISHMDHPGFLVQEEHSQKVILKVMGGVPVVAKNLKSIVEIDILTGERFIHPVKRLIKKQKKLYIEVIPTKKVKSENIFTLHLKDYIKKDNTIYAHRIDDLGGCAAQICALFFLTKYKRDIDVNLHFVFTRAEEVGFIGLVSLIKNGYLSRKDYYISCETSKCIPPIQFGKGVVLRLGDRAGLFEHQLTNALLNYYQKKILLDKYPIQRALLDGGTCEATPLVVNNYLCSGFACPLGNYHNLNEKSNTIDEEFIDISDFTSYVNTIIETSLNFSKILEAYNKNGIMRRINVNYRKIERYMR
ncbi:MAG: hypothetical protein ACK4NF_01905 [Planctomycetota bacterium]